jgi:hypothetical protein
MSSAGVLFVDLVPSLKDWNNQIIKQVSDPAAEAGEQAGQTLSDKLLQVTGNLGTEVSKRWRDQLVGAGSDTGTDTGKALTAGVVDATRDIGTEATKNLTSDLAEAGRQAGAAAGSEIATAVKENTAAAADAIQSDVVSAAKEAGSEAGAAVGSGVAEGAKAGAAEAKAAFKEMAESVKQLGETMLIFEGIDKLKDFFHDAISGSQQMAQIQRQTAAAIQSTGGAANVTADDIEELTEHLANLSGRTDDVVQSSLNVLLTFPEIKNVAGQNNDVFNQTALAVANLSARMGTDLTSSAVLVGKALQDPVTGMTALKRVGVDLSTAQQDQVKQFEKVGDTLDAQKVVLAELNREFAGSAAAAATPAEKLHVAWDRFTVDIGQKVIPMVEQVGAAILRDVIPPLTTLADFIGDHIVIVKILIATFGALTAGLLVYKSTVAIVEAATKTWTVVQKVLNGTLKANPIGLIVTALVALVAAVIYCYNHFETFREIVQKTGEICKEVAVAIWDHALRPAFDGIKIAVVWVIDNWRTLATILAIILGPIGWITLAIVELATHWRQIFDAIMVAVHALGDAAVWLWDNAIKPVFDAIAKGAEILFLAVSTILVGPLILLWKYVLGPVVMWLWHNAIEPAFHGISIAATVLRDVTVAAWSAVGNWLKSIYDNWIKPIVDGVVILWHDISSGAEDLWNNGIKPAFDAIGKFISSTYQNAIKPTMDALTVTWNGLATLANWFWRDVIVPVWHGVSTGISDTYTTFIKPVFDGFKIVIHDLGTAFSDVATAIGTAWNAVKDACAAPIKWVINTVYNDGIVAAWNWIADHVGLSNLDLQRVNLNFAGGGVLGGYQPGRDSVNAKLSPGEAVLVPEAARALGHDNIRTLNKHYGGRNPSKDAVHHAGGTHHVRHAAIHKAAHHAAHHATPHAVRKAAHHAAHHAAQHAVRHATHHSAHASTHHLTHRKVKLAGGGIIGEPHFDGGGVFGWISNNIVDPIGHAASAAWSGVKTVAGAAVDFVKDPIGSAEKLLDKIITDITGNSAIASTIGQITLGLPKEAVSWLIDKLRDWFTGNSGSTAAATGQQVASAGTGVQQWAPQVLQALAALGQPATWLNVVLRRMNQESGGNPNAINNWDVNAQHGDPSRGLMQTIMTTFNTYRNPAWSTNIFDPLNNIYAGLNYAIHRYGTLNALSQPGGYDSGGYLPRGLSLVANNTTKPEPVLTSSQWDSLAANAGQLNGPVELTGTLAVSGNGLQVYVDGRIQRAHDAVGTAITRRMR